MGCSGGGGGLGGDLRGLGSRERQGESGYVGQGESWFGSPSPAPLGNLETCPIRAPVSPSTRSPSYPEVALGGSYVQRPLKGYVGGGESLLNPGLSPSLLPGHRGLGLIPVFVFAFAETEPPGRGENFHQAWGGVWQGGMELVAQ